MNYGITVGLVLGVIFLVVILAFAVPYVTGQRRSNRTRSIKEAEYQLPPPVTHTQPSSPLESPAQLWSPPLINVVHPSTTTVQAQHPPPAIVQFDPPMPSRARTGRSRQSMETDFRSARASPVISPMGSTSGSIGMSPAISPPTTPVFSPATASSTPVVRRAMAFNYTRVSLRDMFHSGRPFRQSSKDSKVSKVSKETLPDVLRPGRPPKR